MEGIEAHRAHGRRERSIVTMQCGKFHPSVVKEGNGAGSRCLKERREQETK